MIDIYRFELIFLNPEENRWQMFQESSQPELNRADGSAIYRREAQALLGWVRNSVEGLCKLHCKKNGRQTFFVSPRGAVPKIDLDVRNLYSRLMATARDKMPAYRDEVYKAFLRSAHKRMLEIIASEKIEAQASTPCERLFDALQPSARRRNVELSADEAMALISALHHARNWDLFGRLSPPELRTRSINSPAFVQQFSYCLLWKSGIDADSASAERALGYRVQIGIADDDDKKDRKEDTEFRMRPYYQYCRDVSGSHEVLSYCFYGLLLDALTSGLATKSRDPNPPREPVYITCLPIRICGYDHFLQLYWRTECSKEPLEKLRFAKNAFVALFGQTFDNSDVRIMGPLKECLRELFVQMHIAAFQHHVLAELSTPRAKEVSIDKLFCLHAPNLVRMEWILLPEGAGLYRYKTNKRKTLETWQFAAIHSRNPMLRDDTFDEHIAEIDTVKHQKIRIYVPWEEAFEGPLNPLFHGTGKDRLQEQYEWLRRTVAVRSALLKAENSLSEMRSAILDIRELS